MYTFFALVIVFSGSTSYTQAVSLKVGSQGITDITSVHIWPNTSEASYWNNNITFIPNNYFIGLPEILSIQLGRNNIDEVMDNSFSSLPSLQELHIGNNQLSIITSHTLRGLFNLTYLYLGKNRIHTIQIHAFTDLRSLSRLFITKNRLTTLDQCVFSPDTHPSDLSLYMNGNDWACGPGSGLCWLATVHGTWLTLKDGSPAQCATPHALAGHDLLSLTGEELGCSSRGE